MSFIQEIREKADFLGVFVATDNYTGLDFFSPHTNDKGKGLYTHFNEYSDAVYFMFVGEDMEKIGKAAGKNGWIGRANQYKQGIKGDQTNKLILETMKEKNKYVVEVLGVRTPRLKTRVPDPLGDGYIECELETAESIEKEYTRRYLEESEDHELAFCKQLK